MNWIFLNHNTIVEKQSGFQLTLLKGSWLDPIELKTVRAENRKLFSQTDLTRKGLEFAYDALLSNNFADIDTAI